LLLILALGLINRQLIDLVALTKSKIFCALAKMNPITLKLRTLLNVFEFGIQTIVWQEILINLWSNLKWNKWSLELLVICLVGLV